MKAKTIVLVVHPALPCGIPKPSESDPDARCCRPAIMAHAMAVSEDMPVMPLFGLPRPGEWILMPICPNCSWAAASVYGLANGVKSE